MVNNGIAIEWAESSQPMNGSVEAVETAVDDLLLLVVDCEPEVEIEMLTVVAADEAVDADVVVDVDVTIVLLTVLSVIIIIAVVVMLLDELFGLEVELFDAVWEVGIELLLLIVDDCTVDGVNELLAADDMVVVGVNKELLDAIDCGVMGVLTNGLVLLLDTSCVVVDDAAVDVALLVGTGGVDGGIVEPVVLVAAVWGDEDV